MKVCPNPNCIHKQSPQPYSNFHKNRSRKDGYNAYCKDCRKDAGEKYNKTDARKKVLRKYTKTDKFKISKKRYRQSDKGKDALKRYNQSDKGKANSKRYSQKIKDDPEHKKKILARNAVNYHVRSNNIPPANTLKCVFCNSPAQEYHHHLGYDKKHRLDVQPVCIPCHRNICE